MKTVRSRIRLNILVARSGPSISLGPIGHFRSAISFQILHNSSFASGRFSLPSFISNSFQHSTFSLFPQAIYSPCLSSSPLNGASSWPLHFGRRPPRSSQPERASHQIRPAVPQPAAPPARAGSCRLHPVGRSPPGPAPCSTARLHPQLLLASTTSSPEPWSPSLVALAAQPRIRCPQHQIRRPRLPPCVSRPVSH